MTSKICDNDQFVGFQSFFRVFTQISPEGTATFGWNIFVRKYPINQRLSYDYLKNRRNTLLDVFK